MFTALGIIGGALAAWQSYRAIDFWRLKSTLREAYGRVIADAILEDQKELNWAALPEWKKQAALYRLLRQKVGRNKAQGIIRAVVLNMASESVRTP
jgi:hypothetical protein